MEVLEKYHEGIIALSACLAGEVATKLRKGDYDGAKETAIRYRNIFGEENYFLEMQDHGIPEQATVNAGIMRLSKELGIPMIRTTSMPRTGRHMMFSCVYRLTTRFRTRTECAMMEVSSTSNQRRRWLSCSHMPWRLWRIHIRSQSGVM